MGLCCPPSIFSYEANAIIHLKQPASLTVYLNEVFSLNIIHVLPLLLLERRKKRRQARFWMFEFVTLNDDSQPTMWGVITVAEFQDSRSVVFSGLRL